MLLVLRKRNLKAVKKDFENLFDEALSVCEIEERSKIKKMANRNKTLTYSYMWMKLDKTSHAPCKDDSILFRVFGHSEPFMKD